MPFFFSERLPLPKLKSYCGISVAVFVASLVYERDALASTSLGYSEVLLSEPFCLWALVNMAYCCLFLCGKFIQRLVLGDLTDTEQQHFQEKFWNFVFYKIIFIFGVINAQSLHEVLCWAAWFSMIGFWHIIGQLCKDRYEYITSSPTTPLSKHIKLYSLIFCVFLSSIGLCTFAVLFGYPSGINQFAFMMAECGLLGLKSLHVLVRYTVQLADFSQSGKWDKKAKLVYYADLIIETMILGLDLVYHFHMLIWSNVFLSMASLVLYWNIRTIFSEMKKKIKRHRMFVKILKNVGIRFPLATREEIENLEDHCAICWDNMEIARKLPCGHFFHHACLCSWLQQDLSCPTCRSSLSADIGVPRPPQEEENIEQEDIAQIVDNGGIGGDLRNYFFYLDGQRIANWFPSFSIEVFHGRMGNNDQEITDMAQQLTTMFPHISRDAIIEDLNQTHSVEATAENILEGTVNTLAPPSDEAPAVIENDEQPSNAIESISSSQSSLVPTSNSEQPSDYESAVEESSGAEDKDGKCINQRRRHYAGEVRRRYHSKSSTTRNPSETASADQQQPPVLLRPFVCEREQRRNVFLEAIGRRQNNSSEQLPS